MKPVTRRLPADPLLPHCSQPLNDYGHESKNGLFHYAATAAKALLKEEAPAYGKLKLSVYDGILSGRHTVAELTCKKYPHAPEQLRDKLMPCLFLHLLTKGKPLFIYPITDGSVTRPQQLTCELSGSAEGLEKLAAALQKSASREHAPFPLGLKRRTEDLRLKVSVSLMRSAADDLRFISRYNEETFFRGLSEQDFASPLLDLSDKQALTGFTVLYAMTFFGLSDSDVFTVDGVFGFTDTGVRSKDDTRLSAAKELSEKLKENDPRRLGQLADKMGAKLLELALPPVDPDDPVALAHGCTMYAGFAQLGKAYLTALPPLEIALVPDSPGEHCQPAKTRASLMSRYDSALQLCQEILTLPTVKKPLLSSLKGYNQALQFRQEIEKEAGNER